MGTAVQRKNVFFLHMHSLPIISETVQDESTLANQLKPTYKGCALSLVCVRIYVGGYNVLGNT